MLLIRTPEVGLTEAPRGGALQYSKNSQHALSLYKQRNGNEVGRP